MTITSIYCLHEIGGKKKQEDYIWPVPGKATADDRIFIVCDGVGGSENGEIASKIVADLVGNDLRNAAEENISLAYINALLNKARQELINYALSNGLNRNMATTFSVLVLLKDKAFIAWCGDTRVYHLRNGEVLYRTEDHSLVNTLVRNGEITEAEAQSHPHKNLILNAVKADEAMVEADGHWIEEIQDGDYFVLCTDGLLENIGVNDWRLMLQNKEETNTDVISYLRGKCLDKTRDNYSMYMVQVAMDSQKTGTSKKSIFLYLTLLLICAAGAAAIMMQQKQRTSKPAEPYRSAVTFTRDSMPAKPSTDTVAALPVAKPDSLAYYASIAVHDTSAKQSPQPTVKDSLKAKRAVAPAKADSVLPRQATKKTDTVAKQPPVDSLLQKTSN